MAKPPKVSKKLWEGRQPLGKLVNGLPSLYIVIRDDGAVWLMQDKSKGEATGAQVCLAQISATVMQQCYEAKAPVVLDAPW